MPASQGVVRFPLPGRGMALLHPDRQRLFVFNETAHFLWRVVGGGDGSHLSTVLAQRFGLEPEHATRDAHAIWDQWRRLGLLKGCPPPNEILETVPLAPAEPMSCIFFRIGPFVVECHGPGKITKLLRSMWPPPEDPVQADLTCVFQTDLNGHGRLVIEDRIILDDAEPEDLIGAAFEVILGRIHNGTRFCAMIHAAAVAADEGAIVVAAPSGSGKSTLTAYLAVHGYTYLSDDLVPLRTQDHAVVPFPMPIRVKAGAAVALKPFYPHLQVDGQEQIQKIAQDTDFFASPRRARMLLFPRYTAGAVTTFDEISVEAALMRLLADGIYFGYPIPPDMVASFLAWLKNVERRVLVYSDFAEAADCIAGTLRS